MDWGSVADWFGAIGTIAAVIVALQKPREPLLFSISNREELLIENLSSLRTRLVLKSKKDSSYFNHSYELDGYGEKQSKVKIKYPLENEGKRIYKLEVYDNNTGKNIKIKIIGVSKLSENSRTADITLYRKEGFFYSQEFSRIIEAPLVSVKVSAPNEELPHE